MKVGIVSDSHDRAEALAQAVAAAAADGAEAIIHCGDVIGAQTLKPALRSRLPIHVIHGNNVGDTLALVRLAAGSDGLLHYHGHDARLDLGGRRIFVVHYPEYARAMACTGDWDVVCCGHSHEAGIEAIANVAGGRTPLVNPGTIAGLAAPATFAMGDLARLTFEIRPVPASAA
jgi:putative phosphoesterase